VKCLRHKYIHFSSSKITLMSYVHCFSSKDKVSTCMFL